MAMALTERAEAVLRAANGACRGEDLGGPALLAAFCLHDTAARKIMASLGVDCLKLAKACGGLPPFREPSWQGLTPYLSRTLDLARRAAENQGSPEVTTGHLLLGLCALPPPEVATLLYSHGLTYTAVCEQVRKLRGENEETVWVVEDGPRANDFERGAMPLLSPPNKAPFRQAPAGQKAFCLTILREEMKAHRDTGDVRAACVLLKALKRVEGEVGP